MHDNVSKTELFSRIQLLEKQVNLLQQGLQQSDRIKKLWQESVTELKKIKLQLQQAEKDLKLSAQVMEYSTEGIIITDSTPTIKIVNPAFEFITGYKSSEVINKNPNILSSGRHNKEYYKKIWDTLDKKNVWQGEIWNRRKEGDVYPELLTICAIKDQDNTPINYIGIFSDISHQKAKELHLQYLANYDGLTNLPNRMLFKDRLEQAIKQAKRSKNTLALLFMDLDHFKQVNDNFGHYVGDLLLQEVATRVQTCLREEDTLCRLGGDEFTIILNNVGSKDDLTKIANNIIKTINLPYKLQSHVCSVGISIGIGIYPTHTKKMDELIKLSDAAMYKAKALGKNCLQFV